MRKVWSLGAGRKRMSIMRLMQRVGDLVREDLGALLPGNRFPLNRESLLRLLLYLCLLIFAVRVFLPQTGRPGRDVPGEKRHGPPSLEEKKSIPEPRSI